MNNVVVRAPAPGESTVATTIVVILPDGRECHCVIRVLATERGFMRCEVDGGRRWRDGRVTASVALTAASVALVRDPRAE